MTFATSLPCTGNLPEWPGLPSKNNEGGGLLESRSGHRIAEVNGGVRLGCAYGPHPRHSDPRHGKLSEWPPNEHDALQILRRYSYRVAGAGR